MNTDVDMTWTQVTEEEFQRIADTFDYARDGWSNAILYGGRRGGKSFGFKLNDGRCFVHPDLAEQELTAPV